jgi:hypothetical protein
MTMSVFARPLTRFDRLHLTVFLAFLVAWTIALLVPIPKEDASEILGDDWNIFYFAKLLHVTAYAWVALLAITLPLTVPARVAIVLGLVGHGVLTEILQAFVGRGSRLADVALDTFGIVLAVSGRRIWLRKPAP